MLSSPNKATARQCSCTRKSSKRLPRLSCRGMILCAQLAHRILHRRTPAPRPTTRHLAGSRTITLLRHQRVTDQCRPCQQTLPSQSTRANRITVCNMIITIPCSPKTWLSLRHRPVFSKIRTLAGSSLQERLLSEIRHLIWAKVGARMKNLGNSSSSSRGKKATDSLSNKPSAAACSYASFS